MAAARRPAQTALMSSAAVKTSLLVVAVLAFLATSAVTAVNLLLDHEDVRTYAISEPVSAIVVNAGSGDVHLVRAGEGVEVRETRHYVTEKPTLDRDVSDGVLTLASHCGHALLRCSADLRVTVPAGAESPCRPTPATWTPTASTSAPRSCAATRGRPGGAGRRAGARLGAHRLGRREGDRAGARAVDAQTDSGDVRVAAADGLRRAVAQTDSATSRPPCRAARTRSTPIRTPATRGRGAVARRPRPARDRGANRLGDVKLRVLSDRG